MKKPVHFSYETIAAAAEAVMRPPKGYKDDKRKLSFEFAAKLNPIVMELYLQAINNGHDEEEVGNALTQFFGYWLSNIALNVFPIEHESHAKILDIMVKNIGMWAHLYSYRTKENAVSVSPTEGGNA